MKIGEHVQFEPDEVDKVADAMRTYVAELSGRVAERVSGVI